MEALPPAEPSASATPLAAGSPFRPWHLWYARAMILVGLGIILYGGEQLWVAGDLVRHMVHARAVVIDYKVFPPSKNTGTLYWPTARFVDPSGQRWDKQVGESASRRMFPIGHVLEIVYDPRHPGGYVQNTWFDIWFDGVCTLALGMFLALLGYGLFLYVQYNLGNPAQAGKWAWLDRYLVPLRIVIRLLGR